MSQGLKDQCILCVAISMSFSIHFAFKYAYTIKNMCRALKSYFRSIGMIPSCRIQSLINQQSYTKYTIARSNSAHAIRCLNFDCGFNEIMRIQNTGKGYQFLYIKTKININVAFQCSILLHSTVTQLKRIKCIAFVEKEAPIALQIVLFPISILSVLYRHNFVFDEPNILLNICTINKRGFERECLAQ